MWFLGCVACLILLVLITAGAGSLLFRVLTGRYAESLEDQLLLLPLGTGALMVSVGCASYLGLRTSVSGPALCGVALLGLLLAAGHLLRSQQSSSGKTKARWALLGVLLLGWVIALLPVLRFNAFNPFGDTITYLSISDYLQLHDFSSRVKVDHPMLMQPLIYRVQYFRMGANFFLAFVQSILPVGRSIEVYPVAMAWGFGLNLTAIFIAGRWALNLSRNWALAAMLLAGVSYSPLLYSVKAGFYPQLLGIAFTLLFCATAVRAFRGGWRARRHMVLPALLLGFVTSAYSELVPMCVLAGAVLFLLRLIGRPRAALDLLRRLPVVLGVYLAAGNIEIIRMIYSLPTQIRAIVGWNVNFSHGRYLAHAFGLASDNSDHDPWSVFGRNPQGALAIATVLACAMLVWGVIRLLGTPRRALLLQWLACIAVFALMYAYFSFWVANPWIRGATGQSWSKFKLSQWCYPFLLLALVSALSSFRRARPMTIAAFALYLPFILGAHWRSAERTTSAIRQLSGDSVRPFAAYANLVSIIQRNYAQGPVQLNFPDLGDHLQGAQMKMLIYYFYPRPLVGHWNAVLSFSSFSDEELNSTTGQPTITLVPEAAAAQGAIKLPAGMSVRRPDSFIDVSYDKDWYPAEVSGDEQWRWSVGASTVSLTAPRGEVVTVRGEYVCALPGKLSISMNGVESVVDCSEKPWRSQWRIERVALSPGKNQLRFQMDGGSTYLGSDPRKLSFRLVNLRVESENPDTADCPTP